MKKSIFVFLILTAFSVTVWSQRNFFEKETFQETDSLRGMLRPERTCFDVTFYDLNLNIDINNRLIDGHVDIYFAVMENFRTMQIDLFDNMEIKGIYFHEETLEFERVHQAVFVHLPLELPKNSNAKIRVKYSGKPQSARNAPWDGGFVWKKDKKNRPWIGVACEGDGASLWWPNKDHLSDEPDSMAINITIPSGLVCASNGNLREKLELPNQKTEWKWFVSYPINNYNVSITIGHLAHFDDLYFSEEDGDTLALDYYVLDYNLEKAKKHFQQVKPMLACYEKLLGKYPFWEDGYSLIETPYLGMEHQSGIAYGNDYMRGYKGGMIPTDMDWDYLIIHESGHEYFGNAVSVTDHCDMWIHESFTTYLEALYVECQYGYTDYLRYLDGQRNMIVNAKPMVGPRDVNYDDFGSSDHYFKGAWVLHTFRHALDDDKLFFSFLKDYYNAFKMKETSTAEFLDFVKNYFNQDWLPFWEQYLYYANIPILDYEIKKSGENNKVKFQWKASVKNFNMPTLIGTPQRYEKIYPVVGEEKEIILKNMNRSEIESGKAYFLIKDSF